VSAGRVGAVRDLDRERPFAGVERRVLYAERATLTSYTFEPGATFPLHRHEQEQVTLVEEGSIVMTIGSKRHSLAVGGWSIVPGGVEHGITAGPDGARIVAVVSPPRTRADGYELVQ
jgi:quercetin dioxygenase-like cupin family protein